MGGLQHMELQVMKRRMENVEGEMRILRNILHKDTSPQIDRNRRDADSLSPSQYEAENPLKETYTEFSEDGVPVVGKNYNSFEKDSNGFRVYNAWYQHRRENTIENDPRVVVKHVTDSPIRAHHRKSAAWSSTGDGDFLEFGESAYSDAKPNKIKANSALNSINYNRNRAKITNPKDYRNENRPSPVSTKTLPHSTESSVAQLSEHMRDKLISNNLTRTSKERRMKHGTEGGVTLRSRGARNRGGLRSGGKRRMRNREGVDHRKNIKDAIHLEADVVGHEGPDYKGAGRFRVADSIFRNWTPSRWARRMKMDKRLSLKDGRITVGSPGIYFIYAQINFLDIHDVNAFQIIVNDSPFLLCTTMTHTTQPTTKANTCYTGAVKFLERGDTVFIKNLEENRFSVVLPSHSFFGLAQLSDMGI